ncbi:MAG: homoserine dehydrogenase [Phycisphaerae bacterium]|nr:homoserine dehydrogenase [Phycisphaerae bacterium]MDD5381232.1 homoserine dehydrogenase [Phycisphaerae bacterium]
MSEQVIKIGLVGFGTIGAGVAKLLLKDGGSIAAKTGLRLKLACVVDTDTKSARPVKLPKAILTNDLDKLLKDDSIKIGIELVGGTKAAKQIQLKMLRAGKDVVTANKALLAEYGNELYKVARENNRCIAFEASCAGGIPIISGLRTGLAANNIMAIYGIVNGTCNYILSNMTSKDEDFSEALKQAQKLGYAEADPSLDLCGGDSAHKLAILASIAFGCEISLDDISVEGIEEISKDDIRYGGEMGYVLKLLAIGQKDKAGRISLRVHPSFIAKDNSLARVGGPFNAISIFGSAVGQVMYYGRGAGMMPTASAVVADVIDVALGNSATTFDHLHLKPRSETKRLIEKIGNLVSRFYIRLMVRDQAGVFAQIGKVLAVNSISISGILQHEGHGPDNTIPVVITTHPTQQSKVSTAIRGLDKLNTVCSKPVCIQIVDIPEDKD